MAYDPATALGALLSCTSDYLFFHDREGRYTYVSDAAAKSLGRTPESMLGLTTTDLGIPEELSADFHAQRRRVMETRSSYRGQTSYGELALEYQISPLIVNGEVAGTIVITHDVTEQRRAEAALRESETKFSTAFERSPLALTITSVDDGTLVNVNEGFVQMSGYPREEAVGRTPDSLGLWLDPQVRAERFRRMLAGEQVPNVEARFRIKDGTELIGVVGSALVEINGRRCVLSSVIDITERKRAEETVRRSEARIREFADTAPAMLWTTDPDGFCTYISRGWLEFTGQRRSQALGLGWVEAVHPDDRQAAAEAFTRANQTREAFELDYRVRRADGEYRWTIDAGRPRFDADGEFLGHIGSVIDITDRKHAEQAKDEFLATLSHELRTPLTSAYGWVKLLGRTREPELVENGLRAIEESLVAQIRLIDDLLDVSRIAAGKTTVDLQPLELADVVHAAVEMVRHSADAKRIALQVDAQPSFVRGDAARLKQVVGNVLSNAVKFTPSGGAVEVTLRQHEGNAEIVVRDTGDGIDPKFLPFVFDRFRQADSSTSRSYGGLGIGLSIVASLVEAHHGSVRAESDGLNKGSTFTVTLPLLWSGGLQPAEESRRAEGRRSTASDLAGARVLVVDDDAATRQIVIAALAAAGAEVHECGSAGEAFGALETWRPNVLISDLAMPQEDGYSLIRRIREAGELLPAVAITAYARSEDEARVRDAGFQRHVAKPFDPEELVRTVRELV
ncbi:MAG TPA: PAS domain S-box protein [Thermoanaerobaculia bacterium]|nr:PAS domain S-box protein [Thermoanaerobaculia bacterium]